MGKRPFQVRWWWFWRTCQESFETPKDPWRPWKEMTK